VDLSESPDVVRVVSYRLDLEYDGTRFSGWQLQPDQRTVQGVIEAAILELFGEDVNVFAAGRTDAGVHATGQVAHFRVNRGRPPEVVLRALNAKLPPDVRIHAVSVVPPEFHARFSAKWRAYSYRIALRSLAIGRQYAWICPYRLDLEAMQHAASLILGDHCFQSFSHPSEGETHYLSTVHLAQWRDRESVYEFHIEANRFLHGMVRLLVGTIVGVGRGKIGADRISEILAARDVTRAGPKAPACGLTLVNVGYKPWPAS